MLMGRHPLASGAIAAALAALMVAIAVTSTLYVRAEAARREAAARFADARGMANYMLTDVFDRLAETPGTIALRRDLVDRARAYLEELAKDPRAPADVQIEAADGYLRLAGVLGFSAAGQLGRREEAEAMMVKAQRLLDGVPAERRGASWLHVAGRLHYARGHLAYNRGDGELKAALPHLDESIRLLRRAAALAPTDGAIFFDLMDSRLTYADVLSWDGRYPQAQAISEAELAALSRQPASLRSRERAPTLAAKGEEILGNALYYQGDKTAALAAYRRGAALSEAEDALRPGRSATVIQLLRYWWNVATTLDELGEKQEALRILDRAVALGRQRRSVDPEHESLARLTSQAVMERAGMLARQGRFTEAMAEAERDMAERRASAKAKPPTRFSSALGS
jgi:tetratricopeptide (TPR) repeat protein